MVIRSLLAIKSITNIIINKIGFSAISANLMKRKIEHIFVLRELAQKEEKSHAINYNKLTC